jgi:hypothetical protein
VPQTVRLVASTFLFNIQRDDFMLQTSRRDFVIRLASLAAVAGSGAMLSACGGGDGAAPFFNYGVASGDPLQIA